MATGAQAYDPGPFNQRIPALTTRLEQLYEATRRAKKRLENVKTPEQHVNYFLHAKIALIKKSLEIGVSPQGIADAIAQEMGGDAIGIPKIVAAIKRVTRPRAEPDGPRKRIGRPPKNATPAATPAEVQPFGTAAAAAGKPRTKPDKSAPPSGLKDSPEREQRMRRRAPIWAGHYAEDAQYAAVVARHDGESDADFYWRMWHTEPPWSGDMPRHANQLTHTQWVEKCWNLKSPQERAAHQASLPSTAR
ncbi:MAG: hypothetical protein LBV61_09090 [Burkholderiaceae bacterium]|jgi:hypothetical protein|nr:hypothetical protein [Burkholderiaceae bacterium]